MALSAADAAPAQDEAAMHESTRVTCPGAMIIIAAAMAVACIRILRKERGGRQGAENAAGRMMLGPTARGTAAASAG